MMPYRYSLALFTCFSCFTFIASPASSAVESHDMAIAMPLLAQAQPTNNEIVFLQLGTQGDKVKELQTKLKQLGYYTDLVTGFYGNETKLAVSKFQESSNLTPDGVVGTETWNRLQAAYAAKTKPSNSSKEQKKPATKPESKIKWLWLVLGIVLVTTGVVGVSVLFMKALKKAKEEELESDSEELFLDSSETNNDSRNGYVGIAQPENGKNEKMSSPDAITPAPSDASALLPSPLTPPATNEQPSEGLAIANPSRMSKINIVEELIKDLESPDSTIRRKAVWELAQRGDSRAVQPLINMMIDADSQQRTLILEALSQICTRILKPMNRALAISLQDESPTVRKNAIRDVTRIYELLFQIIQLLNRAVDDPDREVQETAKWAINQLNRIRVKSNFDNLSGAPNSFNSSENSHSEPPDY